MTDAPYYDETESLEDKYEREAEMGDILNKDRKESGDE